jgi:thiosulfate dehydrogenase
MRLGCPNSLSDQEAWNVASYIDSQERRQGPRYAADVKETREKCLEFFHKHTRYGLEINGKLMGDYNSTCVRTFYCLKLLSHAYLQLTKPLALVKKIGAI